MKLAVTGKGGVGKTTVCSLLARAFASRGHRVLAVDADPNPTLAACLGFVWPDNTPPLSEMADLIEERTGVKPGTQGAMFKLNPRVDDIPERFSVEHDGIRLLRMGTLKRGGAGCYCPENAFLNSLVSHLFLTNQDVLIMDMEAGVEHLGRGTVRGVDWLIVVVEPSRQSIETATRIKSMTEDLGISQVGLIANKCRNHTEVEFVERSVGDMRMLGAIPYDESLRLAELEGRPPDTTLTEVTNAIEAIINELSKC